MSIIIMLPSACRYLLPRETVGPEDDVLTNDISKSESVIVVPCARPPSGSG